MKLRKVQEQEFNPLPTEFQLTPFEMLMQDIRARNYKLRKVMVSCWGTAACPRAFCPPVALQPPLCALATEWVFRCARTDVALTHLAPPDTV